MPNTNVVPQGLFGPGILWLTRTDISNPTPVNIGFINEFSTDISYEIKQLHGQKSLPLLSARGTGKCSGKMKAATLSGQALNAMILGGTWTAGTEYNATTTGATEIPTTETITPTVPNSGTFDADLGVVRDDTNEPMTRVASGPTTGQYSVNESTGAYTFAAADDGDDVKISFAYTRTGATGQSMTFTNPDIGDTPTFQVDYKTVLYGATYYIRLFNAIAGKWSMGHKLSDFAMPEYDFEFFANASQEIGIISLATQA